MSARADRSPRAVPNSGPAAPSGSAGADIDDPDALRHALEQSRFRDLDSIRALISRVQAAVLVADDRACYVAANQAATALTGYPEAELLGLSLHDLTAEVDAAVADRLWTAFVDHRRQRGEFALRAKDGSAVIARYDAIANIVPGLHVSFLRPVASLGRPAADRASSSSGRSDGAPDRPGKRRAGSRPKTTP